MLASINKRKSFAEMFDAVNYILKNVDDKGLTLDEIYNKFPFKTNKVTLSKYINKFVENKKIDVIKIGNIKLYRRID